ncbi:MAG: hypothetical protein DI551_11800 [Micavibrio aeruginosavorus]|uniref:Porin domain-containing protein n=1 Tax=Micavibrio aeruginosavorus TaxID=349221 RepID=A0A2W5PM36_9BACT|nr:MAG: hypothetical protein DI551_11800 [Micavibrio aeruginosavorus]
MWNLRPYYRRALNFTNKGSMTMKNIALGLSTLAIVACAFASSVRAETQVGDFTLSANTGLFSDYVFRGISQSDEGPALQGGFDASHSSGLYAGVWGSNVDFNDDDEASVELDFYAGFASEYQGFTYDLGVIYYAYPGADSDLDYDFWEVKAGLGYDFDVVAVDGSINYSPEFFGETGDAVYYAAGLSVPLPYDFSANAHAGYQTIDDGEDYTDWSLGLGYTVAGFDLSLTYTDTDLDEPEECADGCSDRIVFGVSKSF